MTGERFATIVDTWERPVKKSKTKLRKQFTSWQVSKAVVTRRSIKDGEIFNISVSIGTTPITAGWFKLASGCEVYLNDESAKAIKEMAEMDDSLVVSFSIEILATAAAIDLDFDAQITESCKLSLDELKDRLKTASPVPPQRQVVMTVFRRNPDVVAFALRRANGRCEDCGSGAPFLRAKDGSPYLEVHHTKMLADGGNDTAANALALCPNCHRRRHHGMAGVYSHLPLDTHDRH